MDIRENYPLKSLNTFGLEASARFFAEVQSLEDLQPLLSSEVGQTMPHLVLGGGSNILLTRDFDGLAIKVNILGKTVIKEDQDFVYLKVGAGENWHQLVLFCIQLGYAGIENLSLIPGNVGAAPMQNIGAYGVELKDVFHSLEAIDIRSGAIDTFDREGCEFGYRSSIFKTRLKGQRIITSVTLRLLRNPQFNTSYGAIEQELKTMGVSELSLAAVSDAVCNIRRSKLPDPTQIGNAGSFFKNPVISNEQFEQLKSEYPEIPGYPAANGQTKVAAGWLIEKAGWKGKTINNFGVHKKQALVLVNYGNARGIDIYNLSGEIQESIQQTFGVWLEREVNIV